MSAIAIPYSGFVDLGGRYDTRKISERKNSRNKYLVFFVLLSFSVCLSQDIADVQNCEERRDYLTDDAGNYITDEHGNRLEAEASDRKCCYEKNRSLVNPDTRAFLINPDTKRAFVNPDSDFSCEFRRPDFR